MSTFNEQEIIEKMMLSIREFFSFEPGVKCKGGIVLKSAYKDVLAFLKLKRKDQVQSVPINDLGPKHPEHNDHFDYMTFFPLVPYEKLPDPLEAAMFFSTQPSAPPIPDSPLTDSASVGIKANNLLADFEVHGEQVEYKGRGLVDLVYVPWLEKVCHIHPSLIECQRNRTPKYAGWALTALGRVLHFLETTKVAEMNEEACECLQQLFDEVQMFGFDLSWLAPQVEFALKMSKVNKLEEEKRSLELGIQELSMKLIETEKEMQSSKGDLAKLRVDLGETEDSEKLLGRQRHPAPDVEIFSGNL